MPLPTGGAGVKVTFELLPLLMTLFSKADGKGLHGTGQR